MKLACRLLAILVLAAGAGCRNNNTMQYDALYSELRIWEDEVACLEDERDEAYSRLDSAHRENASLRRQLAKAKPGSAPVGRDEPITTGPPTIELPEGEPYVPPGELPTPAGEAPPGGEAPPYVPPGGSGQPNFPSSRVRRTPQVSFPRRQEAEITDWIVSEITLNRQMTGGHDRDGRPGDEGLMVVIEPRNSAGQIVDVPGEVSVVVLDPSIEGPAGRIARWDFSSAEAAELFRQTIVGKGIHVDLPWPASPPIGRKLNLYVRYTTDDGRKLMSERQILVDPLPEDNVAHRPSPPPHRAAGVRGRIARQALGQGESWAASEQQGPLLAPPSTEAAPTAAPIHDGERTARHERLPVADEEAPIVEDTAAALAEAEAIEEPDAEPEPAPPRKRRPQWSPDR